MKNRKNIIIILIFFVLISAIFANVLNSIYIWFTLVCVLAIFYKTIEIKAKNTYQLTQIALFSSLATMCRCFLYIIPNFNPFLPIIILFSSNTDKDCGFLIGILSIFTSNIFLGHGMWTPWQMLAAGTIGYLSGMIFNKIRPTLIRLAIFSPVCIIFVYSLIMNISSSLLLINTPNSSAILTYLISCFIIDSIYAILSIIFIITLYNPIINIIGKIYKIPKR